MAVQLKTTINKKYICLCRSIIDTWYIIICTSFKTVFSKTCFATALLLSKEKEKKENETRKIVK